MNKEILPVTIETISEEYRAMLEDDVGMRVITPKEQIEKRLKDLFGESLFNKWKEKSSG